MVVTSGRGGCAVGIKWVEARDAANHPARHRTEPTMKNHPAPSVHCPETEKHHLNLFSTPKVYNSKMGSLFRSTTTMTHLLISVHFSLLFISEIRMYLTVNGA